MNEEIIKFLKDKSNYSSFFSSLLNQVERKGSLSPRQLDCVEQAMQKEGLTPPPRPVAAAVTPVQPSEPAPPKVFTLPIGEKIEIKRRTANFLKRKLKMNLFFSNLEVVNVVDENQWGYRIDVRFVSGVCTNCHCCGKALDTDVSRASGLGPVCAKKYFGVKRATVEMSQKILELLDKYCLEVGVIKDIWVRKENIIARLGQAHAPDAPIVTIRQVGELIGAEGATTQQIWNKAQTEVRETNE